MTHKGGAPVSAEGAISREEALRHQRLLESLGSEYFLYAHNTDGIFTYISPSVTNILGYSVDEFMTNYTHYLTAHTVNRQAIVHTQGSIAGVRQPAYRLQIRDRQGEERWLDVREFPVIDDDGSVLAVEGIAHDITHRVETEVSMRRLAEQNRLILDTAGEGIFGLDASGHHTFVNPAAARMLGYTTEDLLGTHSHTTWHHHHADGAPFPDADCPIYRVLHSAETSEGEEDFIRCDGSFFPVRYTASPIIDSGQVTGAVVTFSDISEQRSTERLIQSIVRGTSIVIGEDFLRELVRNLAEALQVRYVFVGEVTSSSLSAVRASVVWAGNGFIEPFEYTLADTPCENVVGKYLCGYEDRIQHRFPKDELLRQMEAESYLGTPLFDSGGRPLGIFAVLDDKPLANMELARSVMSIFAGRAGAELERWHAESKLRQAQAVFENSAEGFLITDIDNRIVAVNSAFSEITGYLEEEVLGKNPAIMSSGRHGHDFYYGMWQGIKLQGRWRGEVWNRRKDGQIYPQLITISTVTDSAGTISSYIGAFSDISDIKDAQERFDYLANHDPLTDLPNRRLFHDRLEHSLERARREGSRIAVLLIDLDRFKNINDSLGHDAGDALLQAISVRLKDIVRQGDTVARLGGDEFAVLIEDLEGPQGAAHIAEKLVASFSLPVELAERKLYLTASAGICLFPDDASEASALLTGADAAMYKAKAQGRNTYQYFSAELTRSALEQLTMESALRRAMDEERFTLLYQPQVTLVDGRLIGVEALIRWDDEILGSVSPEQFIPLAEETGIIIPLGEWVLRQSCHQAQRWVAAGIPLGRIGVNVSLRQFEQPDFVETVARVLQSSALEPGLLELEITERVIMRDETLALDALQRLHALGVRLAVDDFGTGYSSLNYLKRLPIHRLKIDKSFVDDLPADRDDAVICKAIIGLGRAMALEVIAEGVESDEQRQFLLAEGCEMGQGFHFWHPLAADDIAELYAVTG